MIHLRIYQYNPYEKYSINNIFYIKFFRNHVVLPCEFDLIAITFQTSPNNTRLQ